jgi:hypothetical protein
MFARLTTAWSRAISRYKEVVTMESRRNEGAQEKRRPGGQGWDRAVLIALLALLGAGCTHGRFAGRPSKDLGSTPTIGTDFHSVPPGQTIPPAGFGVDLVRGESDAKKDETTVQAAGFRAR